MQNLRLKEIQLTQIDFVGKENLIGGYAARKVTVAGLATLAAPPVASSLLMVFARRQQDRDVRS